MKAKKLMGMIACASACVSLSALANTTNGWFGVAVNETAVNAATCTVTTNNAEVTSTETSGKIVLDNDIESALTIAPVAGTAALSDGLVTITSTAVLTPSDASELGAVTGGAQAGFAVAVDGNETNFYGYASAGKNGDPAWIQFTTGPANPEADTTFTIAINYRDKKVSFYNGSTLLTDGTSSEFSISNEFENLSNVAAYGSGSISSVTSQYEVAVAAATVNDVTKKYGSGAEAVKAAGASGTVQDIDPTTGAATAQKQATNGLYAWQCDVLGIEPNATIPLEPATKEVAADKIAVAVSGYTPVDGVSVKFQVKQGESLVSETKYDADAIGIPWTTGQYTVVPEISAASN